VIKKILLSLLNIYKKHLSPILPQACRFHPTCSEYSREAISKHGFVKGAWLSLLRLLRCNRLFQGGLDPVPQIDKEKQYAGNICTAGQYNDRTSKVFL